MASVIFSYIIALNAKHLLQYQDSVWNALHYCTCAYILHTTRHTHTLDPHFDKRGLVIVYSGSVHFTAL